MRLWASRSRRCHHYKPSAVRGGRHPHRPVLCRHPPRSPCQSARSAEPSLTRAPLLPATVARVQRHRRWSRVPQMTVCGNLSQNNDRLRNGSCGPAELCLGIYWEENQTPGRFVVTSVVVVGAGLSGLAAAYRLQQAGATVTVLESASGPGGRVQTERHGDYIIDTGPDAVTAGYA